MVSRYKPTKYILTTLFFSFSCSPKTVLFEWILSFNNHKKLAFAEKIEVKNIGQYTIIQEYNNDEIEKDFIPNVKK
jgi:hypothetical protein